MTRRVLAVYWNDAATTPTPWTDAGDLAMFIEDDMACVTVGIEVKRDDQAIHVAASLNNSEIGGVWKIPRKMIRRVQVLGRIEAPE